MTQRWIEIVIGRLVIDDDLRRRFSSDPGQTLVELLEKGTHLTRSEIAALIATDSTLWERVAAQIDSTLQETGLK